MMSAVAAPPAPAKTQEESAREQSKRGPMVGLPPIPKYNTVAESQAQRQTWKAPDLMPGETVFYRASGNGHSNEFPAIILRQSNKTFSMLVSKPNFVFEEKKSVEYWDHTEEDPKLTGDPHAPHNNNGTFRRTEFSRMLMDIMGNLGSFPDTAAAIVTMKADIAKIKEELRKIASSK